MERTYCPHCGAKWYIEKLNFTLLENINGYKISEGSVIIEQSAKILKSSYNQKCVSCGYEENQEIKH
jgi:hypothetical protein